MLADFLYWCTFKKRLQHKCFFLWILRNLWEHLFNWTTVDDCSWFIFLSTISFYHLKQSVYLRFYRFCFQMKSFFFKVGLSPSEKNCVICFIESPLKMMKNAFYFILKALFVLKIFKILSWLFGQVEKMAWLER